MSHPYFVRRTKCPACHGTRIRRLYQLPMDSGPVRQYLEAFYEPQGRFEPEYVAGASYTLMECEACGLVYQEEIPNDVLVERLYESWIDPERNLLKHREQDGLGRHLFLAQEIIRLIAYFGRVPGSLSFFDFGMGWGQWALMAKAFGCVAAGCELSSSRVRHAAANGIEIVSWEEIPSRSFDVINTEQVFEHLPDPMGTLLHLKKALAPESLLKISVPSVADLERRLRLADWRAPKGSANSLDAVAPLEHLNLFRRQSLVGMAAAAGLEEVVLPLGVQYRYTCDWGGAARVAKNLIGPPYRNMLRRGAYRFFRVAR